MCHHYEGDREREAYLEALRRKLDVEEVEDLDDTDAIGEAEEPPLEAKPPRGDD